MAHPTLTDERSTVLRTPYRYLSREPAEAPQCPRRARTVRHLETLIPEGFWHLRALRHLQKH
jgi:hypothetical protein